MKPIYNRYFFLSQIPNYTQNFSLVGPVGGRPLTGGRAWPPSLISPFITAPDAAPQLVKDLTAFGQLADETTCTLRWLTFVTLHVVSIKHVGK